MHQNFSFLKYIFGSIIFTLSALSTSGQTMLNNPGFEDEPADATTPMGWFECERGTTPDIFPGIYGVYKEADEGETYVGLITRADGSFESIGQRLSNKLKKDNCYSFQLKLSRVEDYVGYNGSLKLRVWIANRKCQKDQLIYESDFIDSEDWKTQHIKFNAESNAKYLILEAYHPEPGTKGHILIDGISRIINCHKV